jgi:hypothetical protein
MFLDISIMENLISITDFVLTNKYTETGHRNYANFLRQPLSIEMFIPCKLVDGVWVVLEEPIKRITVFNYEGGSSPDFHPIDIEEYQEVKERCLFKGFEYKKEIRNSGGNYTHFLKNNDFEIYIQWGGFYVSGKNENKIETIEGLVKYKPKLTATAQKQIGL